MDVQLYFGGRRKYMRAAQIDSNNIVINFAEVASFEDGLFIEPANSVIGALWCGDKFSNPVPTPPTLENYISSIAEYLDVGAKKKNYDNIINAALRAGYAGPFHDEGVQYATWMDACWSNGYTLLSQVESGLIQKPTVEELLGTLPPCPF